MNLDLLRLVFTYVIAVLVLSGAFYGLVIYELELDDLVKGALIAAGTAAYSWVFGAEIAKQASKATVSALNTPAPGTTVDSGGPAGPVQ